MARATLHVCRDRLDGAGFFLDAVHLPWYPRYYCDVDPELEWAVRARCPILFHSFFAQAPTHALIHSLRRIVKVALIRCSRACLTCNMCASGSDISTPRLTGASAHAATS